MTNMKVLTRFLVLVTLNLHHLVLGEHKVRFSEGYSIHERPPSQVQGEPLLIQASLNLRNILDVSEKNQLLSVETTLRLYWKDSRIRPISRFLDSEDSVGTYLTLNPSRAASFWMPDVFIDQAKAIRDPTYYTKPASLRVYNDSTIRYSSRINYDVACNMDFHRFPVDEQYCQIKFESFGFTNKQIQLKWMDQSQSNVNYNISLAQFSFKVLFMDAYSTDYYDIAYPGLILKLHLTRQIGYHIVQTYIPSSVFVVLAWMSLFIPPESVPGRVGMGMTTLLTLTAMFSSVRNNVPKVSYVSFLDIWMLICMMFVFSCIMEFIVTTILIRSGKKGQGETFELFCKICLPILFILFNLVYWLILLVGFLDGE